MQCMLHLVVSLSYIWDCEVPELASHSMYVLSHMTLAASGPNGGVPLMTYGKSITCGHWGIYSCTSHIHHESVTCSLAFCVYCVFFAHFHLAYIVGVAVPCALLDYNWSTYNM